MRKKIVEESVLFVSILKWLFLASCIGILVGLSTTLFLKVLEASSRFAGGFKYYFLLLPVALFMSSLIVIYLAPEAAGHGTEKVIEAVHKRSGKINPFVVPVKLLATVITIASGGSAGKEGPCAQIGAGISSIFSDIVRFEDKDRKKLVICGISAGFATVFGTPIAGAIFGVEVLFIGGLLYDVLLPSFVAGIVGYQVSSALGVTYFYEPIKFIPQFSSAFFIKVCLSGLFFGLCSLLLIETLKLLERLSKKIRVWAPYKGLWGGVALVILALLFSTRYLGLGLDMIRGALEGQSVFPGAFILKMLFTSITLSFGGSGGIVTPIGPAVAPYTAVSYVISFLMTGHRSVYPSQVLAIPKSLSITVATGGEMKDIPDVDFHHRSKSVTGVIIKGYNKARKGLKKIEKKKNTDT